MQDRKQLVMGLYFWMMRLVGGGMGYRKKLLSAMSDEGGIGNDSSAGSLVLPSESAAIPFSVSKLESQLGETCFLVRAPPCPAL